MKSFALISLALLLLVSVTPSKCEESDSTVAYVKASLPNQIFRCMKNFNLLRCLKYFVLLRLEARDYHIPETSNMTSDFLENILKSEKNLPHEIPQSLLSLDESELNERLTEGFQKFFKNRPIMLRFIPNMLVKVVPSQSSDLEFSLKKFEAADFSGRKKTDTKDDDEDEEEEEEEEADDKVATADAADDEATKAGGIRKKGGQYLQFGIPLVLTPFMVFASFLPMLIPVLKIATAFTTVINVVALVASVLYLARQHAIEREMQQTVYFNPGYTN